MSTITSKKSSAPIEHYEETKAKLERNGYEVVETSRDETTVYYIIIDDPSTDPLAKPKATKDHTNLNTVGKSMGQAGCSIISIILLAAVVVAIVLIAKACGA